MISYRYPNETIIFWLTLLLVLGVIVFTSAATFCLSGVFILAMFFMAYWMNRSHHQQLLESAIRVNPQTSTAMERIVSYCQDRLQPGAIEVYISPGRQLNAYTFGISTPKTIVLYAPLVQIMDRDELAFVIGHEMGHVQLGHTWLNTILGGIAGIPTSFGAAVILSIVFRTWNRACEYSADRAGILTCGNPEKGISALLKLVSGDRHLDPGEANQLMRILDQEDDSLDSQLGELLSGHPMVIKRINQIREYAKSREYQTALADLNRRSSNPPSMG